MFSIKTQELRDAHTGVQLRFGTHGDDTGSKYAQCTLPDGSGFTAVFTADGELYKLHPHRKPAEGMPQPDWSGPIAREQGSLEQQEAPPEPESSNEDHTGDAAPQPPVDVPPPEDAGSDPAPRRRGRREA